MKRELKNVEDIQELVDRFYERAAKDELLAPMFFRQVNDVSAYKDTMYRFWASILLDQTAYSGSPFQKHEDMQLQHQHVVRWLTLILDSIDELYTDPSAEQAKLRAIKIAEVFKFKLDLIRF